MLSHLFLLLLATTPGWCACQSGWQDTPIYNSDSPQYCRCATGYLRGLTMVVEGGSRPSITKYTCGDLACCAGDLDVRGVKKREEGVAELYVPSMGEWDVERMWGVGERIDDVDMVCGVGRRLKKAPKCVADDVTWVTWKWTCVECTEGRVW